MPLTRESKLHDPENFVGVTFVMIDEVTGARVPCRVTFEALTDRARFDKLTDAEWLKVWPAHEKEIEILASANYDNKKPQRNGFVMVDTDELTPLAKTPGRFVA